MIAHYLTVALAKFRATPFTTAANLLTLALGLTCFIAAYGIASFLSSADSYHENASRTFVVGQSVTRPGEQASPLSPSSNPVLARYLRSDMPQLQAVARILPDSDIAVAAGANKLFLDSLLADPDFLRIFDFEFIAGDARHALDAPGSVVLTEEAAARLFGDAPALGQRLVIAGNEEGIVTGVIAPVRQPSFMGALPDSPIQFSMLRNWPSSVRGGQLDQLENWSIFTGLTFVTLPPSMSLDALNANIASVLERHAPQQPEVTQNVSMAAFPVGELVTRGLDSLLFDNGGFGISAIQVLIGLGLLTLLVACVNYANLATAQAATRVKEAGMRKVLGAAYSQMMAQAWLEAVLLTGAAVVLALIALALVAPAIEVSSGIDILYFLSRGIAPVGTLLALLLAVAFCAGCYPALVLSRVRPAAALRSGRSGAGRRIVARVLVGVQFASASFLLILVTVSQLQRNYLERAVLEPRGDPIVILNDLMPLGVDYDTLAVRLATEPGVENVSVVDRAPWDLNGFNTLTLKRSPDAGANGPTAYIKSTGYDYFATLNLRILAGRVFDRTLDTRPRPTYFFGDDPADTVDIVVDRSFAERLGFATPDSAVGQIVYYGMAEPAQVMRIIGVTETDTSRLGAINVAGQALIGGTVYTFAPRAQFGGQHPVVRLARDNVEGAVAGITQVWDELAPNVPVNIRFYDDLFEASFGTFARIGGLFMLLAGCAFVIASFGQLGIAAHAASRRRHEIGVRKTLGATTLRVIRLLLVDFAKPVLIANLAAWPLGYLAAQTYLSAFAHRVELTPGPFAMSMAITLVIAWAAVLGEVLKASSVHPVEVLRHA